MPSQKGMGMLFTYVVKKNSAPLPPTNMNNVLKTAPQPPPQARRISMNAIMRQPAGSCAPCGR